MKNFELIFSLFLLISCESKETYDIPQNMRPLLKNNDTVVFKSTKNIIDTFLIKLFDEYAVSDKRYYHERITISYQRLRAPSFFKFFCIQQSEYGTNISYDGNYFPAISYDDNSMTLNVNGVNYQSVYQTHYNRFHDSIPTSIYYTHTKGIIRFDYSDNDYFEKIDK